MSISEDDQQFIKDLTRLHMDSFMRALLYTQPLSIKETEATKEAARFWGKVQDNLQETVDLFEVGYITPEHLPRDSTDDSLGVRYE